jgi:hypothetical protein
MNGESSQARDHLSAQLRVRLGALSRAFTRRSDESAASHGAHRIALATLALQAALEQARCGAAVPHPAVLSVVASLHLGRRAAPLVGFSSPTDQNTMLL